MKSKFQFLLDMYLDASDDDIKLLTEERSKAKKDADEIMKKQARWTFACELAVAGEREEAIFFRLLNSARLLGEDADSPLFVSTLHDVAKSAVETVKKKLPF